MLLQRRMAPGVNIPPDVVHAVKTCFFGQRTQISWSACNCALCFVTPPATQLDYSRETEKGKGPAREREKKKTSWSSKKDKWAVSPLLSARLCTHYTKQESVRERGQQLVPETETNHNTCSDWTLSSMNIMFNSSQ